jgi:hypothetical protein
VVNQQRTYDCTGCEYVFMLLASQQLDS